MLTLRNKEIYLCILMNLEIVCKYVLLVERQTTREHIVGEIIFLSLRKIENFTVRRMQPRSGRSKAGGRSDNRLYIEKMGNVGDDVIGLKFGVNGNN